MQYCRRHAGDRHDRRQFDPEFFEQAAEIGFDLAEPDRIEIDGIHLGHGNRDLANTEQMQQITMTTGLFAHAFIGIDDNQCGIAPGRAGDHVLKEFPVAGGVDQHIIAHRVRKPNVTGINRNALITLCAQRIGYEGPLKGHAAAFAHLGNGLDLAGRQ